MRTLLKALLTMAFAVTLVAIPGQAQAAGHPGGWSEYYLLSGNGEMFYYKTNNTVWLKDLKNGDELYLQYGWTNTRCGSDTNVCNPPARPLEVRNSQKYAGYEEKHGPIGQNGTWLLYRLCNADSFGDTCGTSGRWRRTTA